MLLLAAGVLLLHGCTFSGTPGWTTEKTLTNYYSDADVVAARFYIRDGLSYRFEELSSDRISELVEKLDSMELTYHFFHTDYFWGGQYGVELDLSDGTFLTYDGTRLDLRSRSRKDPDDDGTDLQGGFLEVTNCTYWDEMAAFFPSVKDESLRGW